MRVAAFLPVKGSSERIPSKNTALLDGKPLFLHTLEKLVECDFIDDVYLDSESDEIFNLASDIPCHHFKRDTALATNKTDGHRLFFNEVKDIESDISVQILCTSPFIEKETIRKGIEAVASGDYDSAVLVRKEKFYLWKDGRPEYDLNHIPNSVDLDDTVIETMGLYVMKTEIARRMKRRIGEKVFMIEASPMEAIDVNFPDDFALANYVATGFREKERQKLNNMKSHLTSSMLSDILDDLKLQGVRSGYISNMENMKLFGRASTLKLRLLKDGENYEGIYDALRSYELMVPGDIIVVENECSDHAYFGELNANLAIRAGVNGAIIDGMTRDYSAVRSLSFPVYSKGYNCCDVRGRATVESINKKIRIGRRSAEDIGIEVYAGDLVFADRDGIIVIPKRHENIVLKKAFETISKELDIILDIQRGIPANSLVQSHGGF